MVGARIDPQLGPLILVSIGGIFVELLKDAALELAPVTAIEARGMLERLKGAALLHGFRGSEPVDTERVSELIGRLSELVADHRERIVELDVNPLICSGQRIVAVDALLVRRHVKN
jgi:acyl-CoA synthetase (NDP forming)